MKIHDIFGEIVQVDSNGKKQVVAVLEDHEYFALGREMQWPEDVAKWDQETRLALGYDQPTKF